MIPRVLAAPAASLLDGTGERFDPAQVLAAALRNEKPGGHGDRAGAAAALELAVWDLNAKLADESAHGGMRADCDVFQMDPGLSYGLTEYARMLQILESHGFDRAAAIPPGAPRRRARLRPRAEGGAGPPDPPAGRLRHSCSVRQEHAFAGGLGIE